MGGAIPNTVLAGESGWDAIDLRRIIRFAIAHHHVFLEPRSGVVAHSAASRKLAEDELMQAEVGCMIDEEWPAFAHTLEAKKQHPAQEPGTSVRSWPFCACFANNLKGWNMS